MSVRKIIQLGDPRLKNPNKHVDNLSDPYLHAVIKDLTDTMHAGNLIGIAAPQIGENIQVFITEPRETDARPKEQSDELRIYINPEIIGFSDEETEIWEACGCVAYATIFAPVTRPSVVTVRATERDGSTFQIKANGILGRVIWHESDHMQGVEFLERVTDNRRILSKDAYIKNIKPLPETSLSQLITIKEVHKL